MITNRNKLRAILISFVESIIISGEIMFIFKLFKDEEKDLILLIMITIMIILYPVNLKNEKKRVEKEYRQIAQEELYYEKIYEEEKINKKNKTD